MKQTATTSSDGRLHLIDPRAAVDQLRKQYLSK